MDDEELVGKAEKLIKRFNKKSSAKSFIESMREAIDEWGYLTDAQRETLEEIVGELETAAKNQGRTDWDEENDDCDEDDVCEICEDDSECAFCSRCLDCCECDEEE